MQKIGKKIIKLMLNLNVGLVVALFGIMLNINSANAATCTTSSSSTSGTTYTGSNCRSVTTSYLAAGGTVKSCSTCQSNFTTASETRTHSSGCTFTLKHCVPSSGQGKVVADCSNASGTLNSICSNYYGSLGSGSSTAISAAGLSSSIYDTCGVYNIKYLSNTATAKVLMCFPRYVNINSSVVSSGTLANMIGGCHHDYHGDDYTTEYVLTDWDGSTTSNTHVNITNYAQWTCCNKTCYGYNSPTNPSSMTSLLYYSAKKCTTTGTCSSSTPGGYITCNTGYYSAKGVAKYTLTTNSNPASYSTQLNCTACTTATSNTSATSAIGATAITKCYLPSGYSSSDSTGSWTYTSNCFYTN